LVITIVQERFSDTFAQHPWPFRVMLIVRSASKLPIDAYMFYSFFAHFNFMVQKKKEAEARLYASSRIINKGSTGLPLGN